MPTAADFRSELRRPLAQAQKQLWPHVDINAGELHRDVGDYPGPGHRMPNCCQVMKGEMRSGDTIVAGKHLKGPGAALTIRYLLPR
jgi:hypothetical protein